MMVAESMPARRHDVDFVRVAVFGLLMIYHTSLIFGTRSFFIKSDAPNRLVDLVSLMSHPWRMSMLFFLSGVVTAALSARKTPQQIVSIRTRQLILPLLFGVFLLVPIEQYVLARSALGLDISYLEFWQTYLLKGEIIDGDGFRRQLIVFDYLWFLAYLWCYTAILMLLRRYAPDVTMRISSGITILLRGKGLWLWPITYLALLRLTLYPVFGETLRLFDDVYAHMVYLAFFMTGAALAENENFWRTITENRGRLLLIATGLFCMLAAVTLAIPVAQRGVVLVGSLRIARSAFQWVSMLAILGFARHHIRASHPAVSYFNKAVLTYYVLHQPVIVLVAYGLQAVGLLDLPAFPVVVLASAMICAALYEGQCWIVRRGAKDLQTAQT